MTVTRKGLNVALSRPGKLRLCDKGGKYVISKHEKTKKKSNYYITTNEIPGEPWRENM